MNKNTSKDIDNPPGQVVNYRKCEAAANGGCYCDGSCLQEDKIVKDRLLKDYILRKQESDSFFKD